MDSLLKIQNLSVAFNTYDGQVYAINDISFEVEQGETLGIVGESGSGKSASMLAVMKLLPENGKVSNGEIFLNGRKIDDLDNKQMQRIRGNEISIIFQDPMTSLNPVFTIGNQLAEAILVHKKVPKDRAWEKAVDMLRLVGIPDPERRVKQYPHELSGGMRQRVMIAIALSCEPGLLIADEPTTALDVTIQAQILDLMKELKEKINMSIILITHDFGVVADMCDRVIVMYGGMIVEQGKTIEIFNNPQHPYTIGLLNCIPRLGLEVKRLRPIDGQPPNMTNQIAGCPFVERCTKAMNICAIKRPEFKDVSEDHGVACWIPREI